MKEFCYALKNTDQTLIGIYEGQTGYHQLGGKTTQEEVDTKNSKIGVSRAEAETMHMCSMFDSWGRYSTILKMFQEKFPELQPDSLKVANIG